MTQDDIKPGEQLTLAQINWMRKQAQARAQSESGNGGGGGLLQDGPTVAEYVEAGYKASNYPPQGYASRSTVEEIEEALKREQDAPETDPLKMKVDDLKAWLTGKGIEFPADAKKDDLKALVPAE